MLTCPLCGVLITKSLVPPKRERSYMYEHLVSHYRTELAAYVIDKNICRLCGKEQRPRNLLRHVADVHGVLDQLLPKEVSRLYPKKGDAAARQSSGSLEEEEEEEMKIDVKSHFQVDN
jgi:hypothetical protein